MSEVSQQIKQELQVFPKYGYKAGNIWKANESKLKSDNDPDDESIPLLREIPLPNAIRQIFEAHNIPPSMHDEAETAVLDLLHKFQKQAAIAALPDKAPRDYRRGEGIISYLQNEEEGLGRWFKAGVLTRAEIGRLAPRAYSAIANLLRTDDGKAAFAALRIPKQKELTDEVLASISDDANQAIRAQRALDKRAQRSPAKPEIRL